MLQRVAKTRKFPAVYAVRSGPLVKVGTTWSIRGTLKALGSKCAENGGHFRLLGYHWAASMDDAKRKAKACRERLADCRDRLTVFRVSDEDFEEAIHQTSIGQRWLDTVPDLHPLWGK